MLVDLQNAHIENRDNFARPEVYQAERTIDRHVIGAFIMAKQEAFMHTKICK